MLRRVSCTVLTVCVLCRGSGAETSQLHCPHCVCVLCRGSGAETSQLHCLHYVCVLCRGSGAETSQLLEENKRARAECTRLQKVYKIC